MTISKRFTEAEATQIVQRYRNGESLKALHTELKVDRDTIRRLITSAGLHVRRSSVEHRFDLEKAAAMYRDGSTLPQLASHFNVARQTVERYLRNAGVVIRPSGYSLKSLVLREFRKGINPDQIAISLGITADRVLDLIRAAICGSRRAQATERSHDRA
jgi:DNA-binding CsgD family transcriptional regulator